MTIQTLPRSVSRLIERLVSAERATGSRRALLLTTAFVAIVVIALVNGRFDIALRAFYALPVVVVTVAVSSMAGVVFAGLAAAAWTLDRAASNPVPAAATAANAVLRFGGLVLLVVIVGVLRGAIETARAAERRSREFLGFAAHQLRTPLAGVRASAEALMLTEDAATRDRLLIGIAGEAGRMGRLVSSLLRIARLDQGEALAMSEADPTEVVRTEVERARGRAPALRISMRGVAPPRLRLDGTALGEIVGNLLDNARRHAHSQVDVVVMHDADVLRVEIGDDGPGLPSGEEDRAFERFVSLDERGGTGLGLPIARALAEAHGGSLAYRRGQFVIAIPTASAGGPQTSDKGSDVT